MLVSDHLSSQADISFTKDDDLDGVDGLVRYLSFYRPGN